MSLEKFSVYFRNSQRGATSLEEARDDANFVLLLHTWRDHQNLRINLKFQLFCSKFPAVSRQKKQILIIFQIQCLTLLIYSVKNRNFFISIRKKTSRYNSYLAALKTERFNLMNKKVDFRRISKFKNCETITLPAARSLYEHSRYRFF